VLKCYYYKTDNVWTNIYYFCFVIRYYISNLYKRTCMLVPLVPSSLKVSFDSFHMRHLAMNNIKVSFPCKVSRKRFITFATLQEAMWNDWHLQKSHFMLFLEVSHIEIQYCISYQLACGRSQSNLMLVFSFYIFW